MRVMLLGATGLVGGQVLPMLLDDPRCRAVVAPTRRPLALRDPKLHAPVLQFDALPDAPAWARVDAVICALGSTLAQVEAAGKPSVASTTATRWRLPVLPGPRAPAPSH